MVIACTLDVDSTICEAYGLHKQGGSRFTYTYVRGHHPLTTWPAAATSSIHDCATGTPTPRAALRASSPRRFGGCVTLGSTAPS